MTPPNDMPADTELREQLKKLYNESRQMGILRTGSPIDHMVDGAIQLIHARDERREREIEAKFRMDNIYAIGGITDYQIILFKDKSEVMRTPIYDIHTQLIAQGTTNQPNDVKEEG